MKQDLFILPDRLRELFHPRSIALVGATDASRWSVSTFENLKHFGFAGPIYCVNPNHTLVHGQPAVKRLSEISHSPNGNGFINVVSQIVPYGLPIQPPLVKGPVGVVLQSGALASAVIALAQARHIGLSLLVSMGNEALISATDAIDYLIEDDETRVIAVFLESCASKLWKICSSQPESWDTADLSWVDAWGL